MGIAPYKTFTFDGESSADYGVYITGEGVFNAPERAVEMVDIPGRNGSYALDQGRFGNIEVTYTAGMVDDSETNFADRLANVRNWLCSKKGYVRLEDDYNPDEYRMAVYSSGISVEHADLRTGEFEISFDCKPQRWLTSGETAVSVTSGNTITNPTRFDAEPLLEVKGYGGIEFNGYEIDVENAVLGDITIADGDTFSEASKTYTFDTSLFNPGDVISISGHFDAVGTIKNIATGGNAVSVSSQSASDSNAQFTTTSPSFASGGKTITSPIITNFSDSVSVGTNKTITNTATVTCSGSAEVVGAYTCTWTITQTISYNASAGTITVSWSVSVTSNKANIICGTTSLQVAITIVGDSTVSALGNPTYIDCEIGEAYMIKNGNIVSCNQAVALGSDLPKLAPGANTITYDNTVTELKIHPRWWRV